DEVVARAAREGIGAGALDQPVVAVAAAQGVVAVAAIERVVAVASGQRVSLVAAVYAVVAAGALEYIAAATPLQGVIATAGIDGVVAAHSLEQVGTGTADDEVARTAAKNVLHPDQLFLATANAILNDTAVDVDYRALTQRDAAEVDGVVAIATMVAVEGDGRSRHLEKVVAGTTKQRIVAGILDEEVVAGAAGQFIVSVAATQRVAAGAPEQAVVAAAPVHAVVAPCPLQDVGGRRPDEGIVATEYRVEEVEGTPGHPDQRGAVQAGDGDIRVPVVLQVDEQRIHVARGRRVVVERDVVARRLDVVAVARQPRIVRCVVGTCRILSGEVDRTEVEHVDCDIRNRRVER